MARVLLGIAVLLVLVVGGIGAWSFVGERTRRAQELAQQRAREAIENERAAEAAARAAAEQAARGRAEAASVDPVARPDPAAALRAELAEQNNRAIQLMEEGKLVEAVALLEECVTREPEREVYRRNLAEALARLARKEHEQELVQDALEHLARAVELAPTREDLAELLARWREEARTDERFWHDASPHFDLSYDGERGDLLEHGPALVELLERIYGEQHELFGLDCAGGSHGLIKVSIYRREQFQRLTGLGDWSAGAFDGRIRLPIDDLKTDKARVERVLRHELAHAFVRASGGAAVPGWLNEGLAQYLEAPSALELAMRAKSLAGHGGGFALGELQGSLASWSEPALIQRAYDQSVLLVHALAREYGERLVFELVAACGRGESPEATFAQRLGFPLERVQY